MDHNCSPYTSENNQDFLPWFSTATDQNLIDRDTLVLGSFTTQMDAGSFESYVPGLVPEDVIAVTQENSVVVDDPSSSLTVIDSIPVSTAFHAGGIPHPNTLFLSSDGVLFYVHDKTLLERCPKAFQGYLSSPVSEGRGGGRIIQLNAPSAELNVILHALYGTSAAAHSPDTTTLINAVDRMPAFSIPPDSIIRPSTELYGLLLAHAPLRPLDIYALAARYNLSSLASSASTHLLSYDLNTISDDMVKRMGAVYFKRLAVLHLERHRLLKQILLRPPHPHPPTDECGFKEQEKLMRTWALLSAYFVWDRQADLSPSRIRAALASLAEQLTCNLCNKVLEEKIKDAVVHNVLYLHMPYLYSGRSDLQTQRARELMGVFQLIKSIDTSFPMLLYLQFLMDMIMFLFYGRLRSLDTYLAMNNEAIDEPGRNVCDWHGRRAEPRSLEKEDSHEANFQSIIDFSTIVMELVKIAGPYSSIRYFFAHSKILDIFKASGEGSHTRHLGLDDKNKQVSARN
ncbi:hypothetical protein CVT26_006673 [Gymnopilus dilepis]|uniref:BTB domain-containing protein n=1 Tax=Gymnopilus dilepis TaxID=231916 RepID=A0A409Y2Q7_9AGAR|nr:hypothetical protein CVT26_006673 [Gymnopilus dilepis]